MAVEAARVDPSAEIRYYTRRRHCQPNVKQARTATILYTTVYHRANGLGWSMGASGKILGN